MADLAVGTDESLSNGGAITRTFSSGDDVIARELPYESVSLDVAQTCAMPWADAIPDCEGMGMTSTCRTFEMRSGSRVEQCVVQDARRSGSASAVYLNETGEVISAPRNAEAYGG